MRKLFKPVALLMFFLSFAGCAGGGGNVRNVQNFLALPAEPEWIRDGEPIVYDNENWYPADDVESLMDSEVLLLGQYRGAQFFVDKVDVRPYERIYTKFGRNKFRYFTKRNGL